MKKSIISLSAAFIAVVVAAGLWSFKKDNLQYKISKNIDIFFSVYKQLQANYVSEPDPDKIIPAAIDEMLSTLDPYTTYIPEDQTKDYKSQIDGKYGGVGSVIQLCADTNLVQVREVYRGTPSDKAGLRAGDRFLSISGVDMRGKSTKDVSSSLRGDPGQTIEVVIERPNVAKPITLKITREIIKLDAVDHYCMLSNNVGYISLRGFETDCAKEVKTAFLKLRDEMGAKSLILDLRGNPGGLLNEALDIVNIFVPRGSKTLAIKGRTPAISREFKATDDPLDTVIPLVVFVNRGSASASEIVAGALQDLDRAVVVGTRSFGKGLVQSTKEVAHNGLLKVTTAKYYTPSGRCIQAIDYSHRDENGAVSLVPDSLITEFRTRGGRKVYDGGGVSPDILIGSHVFSPAVNALIGYGYDFRYYVDLLRQGRSMSLKPDGHIEDAEFERFVDYMKTQKDFSYVGRTKAAYDKMVEAAKYDGIYDEQKEMLDKLKENMQPNLERDLRNSKDYICSMLEFEAALARSGRRQAYQFSIRADLSLDTALTIASDFARCKGILDGSLPSHAGDKRAASK